MASTAALRSSGQGTVAGITTYPNLHYSGVPRGGSGVQTPPPEIPKTLQNRAKLNPTVKTVKKMLNLGRQHPKMFGKKAVKF